MTRSSSKVLALVARVSVVGGREGERFQSPGQQIEEGTRVARKLGYDVKVFRADAEGEGVKSDSPFDERPGMGAALREVDAGTLDGIIVSALDRLVREDAERGVTLRAFQKRIKAARAVLIVCDTPDATIEDPDEYEQLEGLASVPLKIRLMMDTVTREEAGKKWRKARKGAIERGVYVAPPPAGFDKDKDGRLVPNQFAPAIREAFKTRSQGASWSVAAAILTKAGVPTSKGRKTWSSKVTARLMENPAYIGVAKSGKYVNPEAHEPLVSRTVFARVQASRGRKGSWSAPRKSQPALLQGIIKCGTCGGTMTRDSTTAGGKQQPWSFYRCHQDLPCQARASIGEDRVDEYASEWFLANSGIAAEPPPEIDLAPLERELEEAEGKIEELVTALGSGEVSPTSAAALMGALETNRDASLQALQDASSSSVVSGRGILEAGASLEEIEAKAIQGDDLRDFWTRHLKPEHRRVILQLAIEKIEVAPSGGKRLPVEERVTIHPRLAPGTGILFPPPARKVA